MNMSKIIPVSNVSQVCKSQLRKTVWPLMLTSVIAALPVYIAQADDTEIYLDQLALPPEQTRPNLVFILDSSGSMGLPVDTATNGTGGRREEENYVPGTTYAGDPNFSGGAGDSNFIYLYAKPNTFADQYIYVNKVHTSQLLTGCGTIPAETSPYPITNADHRDRYLYNAGGTPWLDINDSGGDMCYEYDATCGFTSGSGGPEVDCFSEQNAEQTGSEYPTDNENNRLYAVSANFHNYLQGYYRYTTLLTVMKDVIDTNYDINMSMMRFNGGDGGYVFQESTYAADPTDAAQTAMRSALDNIFEFDDSTPLTETLWEGYRYLAGLSDDFGDNGGSATTPAAYIGNSSANNYNSPIDYSCQKSYLIVLTDGAPTNDNGRNGNIQGASYTGSNCAGNCLDEFAGWLHTDLGAENERRDHSGLSETQQISVHTIGFGAGADPVLLQNAANAGGGDYVQANDAETLFGAITAIAEQAEFESDTSVAPAVAVNSYSGLVNRDELYYALFRPNGTPRWTGNIKKYRLVDGVIVDANGDPAVDEDTGYFDNGARSLWTTSRDLDGDGVTDYVNDGPVIELGGFASQLTTPTARKMYTFTGTAPVHSGVAGSAPTAISLNLENLDLNSANDPTIPDNTNITADPTLLGPSITTLAEAQDVVNWARGGTTDVMSPLAPTDPPVAVPSYFVADAIHNPPVVVTYTTTVTGPDVNGNVTTTFKDYVFAGTNMGTFHAIDADSGEEVYSFVPQELLPNLTTYYANIGGFTDKVYGLDGEMVVWRYDADEDNSITTGMGSDDHVYIYQPMRRGGSNIYAFDVTDTDTGTPDPKLLWQIVGTGLDATPSGDYRDLAQTWSAPQRATIYWCAPSCGEREVLFFGGGYDPIHDTATTSPATSTGNAIYMVDAETSELLWSAGNGASRHDFHSTDMDYSFTADVTVNDIDGDNYADFLFAVDITGKVWRFDFDNTATSSSTFATGGQIADLGDSGSSDFRRFYNAPDVAYFALRGQNPFLTISIPSGHREDPREDDLDDNLYVIFDNHPLRAPASYNYVGGRVIMQGDMGEVGSTDPTSLGWYLPLTGLGEKGLSRTITFNGNIFMSTFLPAATGTCDNSTGEGRLYTLNALTGESTIINDNDTPDDPSDDFVEPYTELIHGGIPPEPTVIFGKKEVCVANCDDGDDDNDETEEQADQSVCVGTECVESNVDLRLHKTYWREN